MLASVDRDEVENPFLVSYAVPRVTSPDVPGFYSSEHEMWMVNINGAEEPLIEKCTSLSGIVTKTMTQQEVDDQPNMKELSCLLTKTNTIREQDDEISFSVLDMATKTESQQEHDDIASDLMGLFI